MNTTQSNTPASPNPEPERLGPACPPGEACPGTPPAPEPAGPACPTAPPAWEQETFTGLNRAVGQTRALLDSVDPQKLQVEDLSDFGHVVQALTRLSDCAMKCERHRFDMAVEAAQRALATRSAKAGRGLTPKTADEIQTELKLF